MIKFMMAKQLKINMIIYKQVENNKTKEIQVMKFLIKL